MPIFLRILGTTLWTIVVVFVLPVVLWIVNFTLQLLLKDWYKQVVKAIAEKSEMSAEVVNLLGIAATYPFVSGACLAVGMFAAALLYSLYQSKHQPSGGGDLSTSDRQSAAGGDHTEEANSPVPEGKYEEAIRSSSYWEGLCGQAKKDLGTALSENATLKTELEEVRRMRNDLELQKRDMLAAQTTLLERVSSLGQERKQREDAERDEKEKARLDAEDLAVAPQLKIDYATGGGQFFSFVNDSSFDAGFLSLDPITWTEKRPIQNGGLPLVVRAGHTEECQVGVLNRADDSHGGEWLVSLVEKEVPSGTKAVFTLGYSDIEGLVHFERDFTLAIQGGSVD